MSKCNCDVNAGYMCSNCEHSVISNRLSEGGGLSMDVVCTWVGIIVALVIVLMVAG